LTAPIASTRQLELTNTAVPRARHQEAVMPLMYLPLIMYTGWMEFLFQPLRQSADRVAEVVLDDRVRL
jgi:hypothetical protein